MLAVHNNYIPETIGKWGLPGGGLEPLEMPEQALRRELREEFSIEVGALLELGDYDYRGRVHKVYGTLFEDTVTSFDPKEILEIAWYSVAEVEALHLADRLHTKFEFAAICRFEEYHR